MTQRKASVKRARERECSREPTLWVCPMDHKKIFNAADGIAVQKGVLHSGCLACINHINYLLDAVYYDALPKRKRKK